MLSDKRMRNETDDKTSTASNEDIFSSSGEDDAESSEEMNDSDESEEGDPCRVLIHEAAMELRTKHNELVQSFQNDRFSVIDAKKQAFSKILPDLRISKGIGKYFFMRIRIMCERVSGEGVGHHNK